MLFVFMTMILDSAASPAGLLSVRAAVNGTQLSVSGFFRSGETTPILVWPRKDTWHNPCREATDLCCIRDLLLDYQNDALQRQQGPRCMTELTGDLVSGSREGVSMQGENNFSALVPLDTPFVAMMFVHKNPFYALDGVQTFSLKPGGVVETGTLLQNSPCYHVEVPGRPFKICMHCNNILKPNAKFVWTPTWYIDYVCDWQCIDGYQIDSNVLNPQCTAVETTAVPLMNIVLISCAVVVAILIVCFCMQKKPPPPPPPEIQEPVVKTAEVIQFRENTITPLHIRIKMN